MPGNPSQIDKHCRPKHWGELMYYNNPYDEAPGTRRPSRQWFRWFYKGPFRWQWLSYRFRYQLVMEWHAYELTAAYQQKPWDEFRATTRWPEGLPPTPPYGFGTFGIDWTKDLTPEPLSTS